ncbi:MAG: SLC13 family permease [Parvularculales bacterium]
MDMFTDYPWQIWGVYGVIIAAITGYVLNRIDMALVSLCAVIALLALFQFFPLPDATGTPVVTMTSILSGFAHPALMSVLALLVIGQALYQSDALNAATNMLTRYGVRHPHLVLLGLFITAMLVSAFLNNTPVVIIFIPILAALARRMDIPTSRVMMPLSFLCILGGMTTLIGSSTNMLAAGSAEASGMDPIGFFDFALPGLVLAGAGGLYMFCAAPFLLPNRQEDDNDSSDEGNTGGRQYIAQIHINARHRLIGEVITAGTTPDLKNITIRSIRRGERTILPPFDGETLMQGDILLIAATRQTLAETLKSRDGIFKSLINVSLYAGDESQQDQLSLTETVVAPGSRMAERTVEQISFYHETECFLLGIQRRHRMLRLPMDDIRLKAGDVLLVMGTRDAIQGLRHSRDLLLMEWSTEEVPDNNKAKLARLIFGVTIVMASTGLLPIVVAAVAGATAMVLAGVLDVRQAVRALDVRIYLLIGASLAMAGAMQETGGATLLATSAVALVEGAPLPLILSAFFLLIALLTNVLSNNATAVLFVPIALNTAHDLGVDPMVFVYTVILAANCSFLTPIAYQTNLLVMAPGHYQFRDYIKLGLPLLLILWVVYSLFAPWYYGLV